MTATATTTQKFPILPTERALLVGKTGCGKSTLAKSLLRQCYNIVIVDPKGDFDFPGRIISDPRELSRLKRQDETILYQPHPDYWGPEYYDGVFRWIYERRNTTVYIDEMYGVMHNGRSPHWLQAILTRGRSLKIRTLAATQRPFSIPISLLTETEHRFMFALDLMDDKKRMAELIGPRALQPLSDEHAFLYYYTRKPSSQAQEYILKKGK